MTYKANILVLLKDIRFWILFFFILRLYGITFSPLEVGHNWRQTDGLMIARNFYEVDANIFYPRVDVAGEKTGIVGSEFPILNYIIYLVSVVFGFENWYGRLIVLVVSSFGIFYFYKTIKKFFGEETGFYSALVLLVSLWFSYSRKIIPDAFAASLCFFCLYNALEYLEKGKCWRLILFFFFGVLGCLSKILAATILTVLIFPMLTGFPLPRKITVSIFSLFIVSAVCWWYFLWVPHLNSTFGFEEHFFMGLTYEEGWNRILGDWPRMLKRFYSTPFKYIGFGIFSIAIFSLLVKRQWTPLKVFIIPFLLYWVLMVKTGTSMLGDHYYLITVIPSMSFIIGFYLAHLKKRNLVIMILLAISIESIADQIYDFRIRQPFQSLAKLESIVDQISQRSDLIAINAPEEHNPTPMYFAHRRGWNAPGSSLSDSNYLRQIRSKGCKYVVVVKKLFGDLTLEYRIVHESEDFRIYDVNSPLLGE